MKYTVPNHKSTTATSEDPDINQESLRCIAASIRCVLYRILSTTSRTSEKLRQEHMRRLQEDMCRFVTAFPEFDDVVIGLHTLTLYQIPTLNLRLLNRPNAMDAADLKSSIERNLIYL